MQFWKIISIYNKFHLPDRDVIISEFFRLILFSFLQNSIVLSINLNSSRLYSAITFHFDNNVINFLRKYERERFKRIINFFFFLKIIKNKLDFKPEIFCYCFENEEYALFAQISVYCLLRQCSF